MHPHSFSTPPHHIENSKSKDYTNVCQQFQFLTKHLPLREVFSGKILTFQQMLLFKEKKYIRSLNFKTTMSMLFFSKRAKKNKVIITSLAIDSAS